MLGILVGDEPLVHSVLFISRFIVVRCPMQSESIEKSKSIGGIPCYEWRVVLLRSAHLWWSSPGCCRPSGLRTVSPSRRLPIHCSQRIRSSKQETRDGQDQPSHTANKENPEKRSTYTTWRHNAARPTLPYQGPRTMQKTREAPGKKRNQS